MKNTSSPKKKSAKRPPSARLTWEEGAALATKVCEWIEHGAGPKSAAIGFMTGALGMSRAGLARLTRRGLRDAAAARLLAMSAEELARAATAAADSQSPPDGASAKQTRKPRAKRRGSPDPGLALLKGLISAPPGTL